MISPEKQKIIQIEITNACPNRCANCTRFVGHHKSPFMMEVDQFKKAVDSLAHFPGMVGIMGGEPTLHPKFVEIAEYVRDKVYEPNAMPRGRNEAQKDFGLYSNTNTAIVAGRKRGLWSSLGDGYYNHFELIQETFGYQCLNDHRHKGKHISLLMTRKELGIADAEWFKLRDACWVQREWSASITPKGAFFCEVAAALDMLYNGPGGWPIEPGWWKREPKDFGDQLKWCEMCSACLAVPRAEAESRKDIISPFHADLLRRARSPKYLSRDVEVIDLSKYDPKEYQVNQSCEPYLDPDAGKSCRINKENRSLKPRKIQAITVCLNYDDYLAVTIGRNAQELKDFCVVTAADDFKTQEVCKKAGVMCFISHRIRQGGPFAKGKAINDALEFLKPHDWVLIMDADIILQKGMVARLKDMTLNPGALYFTRRWGPKDVAGIDPLLKDFDDGFDIDLLYESFANKSVAQKTTREANDVEAFPYGYFQLFNVNARALQGREAIYEERFGTAEMDDSNFGMVVFSGQKVVQLPEWDFDIIHLPHGGFKINWQGRKTPRIDCEATNV